MWWTFNFVANYAYPKYSLIIGDILKEQQLLEGEFAVKQEGTEKEALALYKESPARAAAYLSDYSTRQAEKTHSSWISLGERLMVKYNDGVVKSEYGKPINVGYPEEFRKAMAAEAGDKLKFKKLPGEDERIYADAVREAEHKLKEKKYEEAKELYSKALKAKPEDQTVKSYIEQIDKAISELDQIHDKYFNNSSIGQTKTGGSHGG
jgi:tetratricopeptide (TPR) repeat protein